MHYDNLSLIYENKFNQSVIREDSINQYRYYFERNNQKKLNFLIENVLNQGEIEFLIQEGFLSPIVNKAQQLAKKYILPAAVVLSLLGITPQGQAQEPKKPQSQEEMVLAKDIAEANKLLERNIEIADKVNNKVNKTTSIEQMNNKPPQVKFKKQLEAIDQMVMEKEITPQRGAELKGMLLNSKFGYTEFSKAITPLEKQIMLANIMINSHKQIGDSIENLSKGALGKFKNFQNMLNNK